MISYQKELEHDIQCNFRPQNFFTSTGTSLLKNTDVLRPILGFCASRKLNQGHLIC